MKRTCGNCGSTYPRTSDYFFLENDTLDTWCKSCRTRWLETYTEKREWTRFNRTVGMQWDDYIVTYRFIEQFLRENAVAPSFRQIAQNMDISLTTANYRVGRLIEWGYLQREGKHTARTLQLTNKQFVWWIIE